MLNLLGKVISEARDHPLVWILLNLNKLEFCITISVELTNQGDVRCCMKARLKQILHKVFSLIIILIYLKGR